METKTALVHLFKGALGFASLAFLFWSLRRRLIGLEGVVLEEVDSGPYALIMVAGQKWLALAADGNHLRPGEKVTILRVQGLQLAVVSRRSSAAPAVQAE